MAQARPTKGRKKTTSPDAQTLERMLYYLKLTREAETRIEQVLYRQGKIVGGVYVGRGQEAIGVGSAIQLVDGDVALPSHRDFSSFLIRGFSLREIFCNWMARSNGPSRGRENTLHIGDTERKVIPIISHLGDTCPVACGVGMVLKWRKNGNVALVHFGEGTTSRGDVHEAMNMAAVMKLPVIFICNNNAYAYSTPTDKQYAIKDLASRGAAYGMPGVKVDGNDVLAVYSSVEKAILQARSGRGPAFIECKTFRMTGHSAHDAAEYVPEKLFAQWKKKDPIARLEKVALAKKILSRKQIDHLDEEVRKHVDDAVAYAEASPFPEGPDAREGVYCDDNCWWRTTPQVNE
ncbi:MAG TPA: thiamine pyrophosphate-dependent dehydrogenase E1 component subunit alpha [Terriglobia bacterium]|nr:thiamine pyrophosphate-dependent dehydrogenase E1 component subunit alpha [Terriglobia bacterium]